MNDHTKNRILNYIGGAVETAEKDADNEVLEVSIQFEDETKFEWDGEKFVQVKL